MTCRPAIAMTLLLAGSVLPAHAAAPTEWEARGVGGGGALYSPRLSPHAPGRLFVACDMSELFRSDDFGRSYQTLDFREIQATHETAVQFTPDPNLLYALDDTVVAGIERRAPSRSTDGGLTWTPLAADPTDGDAWSVHADPGNAARLLVGSYDRLYLSTDGGASFAQRWSVASGGNGLLVAGALWDGALILVGTNDGLLVSSNGGASFARASVGGIPAGEAIVSFAGAVQSGVRRLYAVTQGSGDVYNGITGADHFGYRGVYVLDWGQAAWTPRTGGIAAGDHPFFVSCPTGDIGHAMLGGGGDAGAPTVYRTVNGGQSWQATFNSAGNANVVTGWSGQGGDRGWGYGECALGFTVSPASYLRAAITDYGFVHVTEDGGATWRQAYVAAGDEHPAGQNTPPRRAYHGIGIENTTAWSLVWSSASDLFAGQSDIRGVRSGDGGATWSFDYTGHTHNSMYRVVRATSGVLYGATSTVHDLYQSTYLTDSRIDGGDGSVLSSADGGRSWQLVHDFNHPVIWVATDPSAPGRLYASVVHSSDGGIWVTDNVGSGSASSWTRLPSPARTEGHPFNVQVLHDGTLVATWSARRNGAGAFTASSGVFVSTDGGASWADRSDPGMRYWTKDLLVDPHDASQQTWYVGVYSGWGGPPNGLGGLYRTRDRGLSWTRIHAADRVGSATANPIDSQELYFTTEVDGLWRTGDAQSPAPSFLRTSYPFRQPERVFFNPYDPYEVWVTSFGNGLRVGHAPNGPSQPVPRYRLYHDGTKEHFYTTDANEYVELGLRGWVQEGIAHRLLDGPGPYQGFTPLPCYRFYQPGIQQHFWTTDAHEASVLANGGVWLPEGVDGHLLPPAGVSIGAVPLYRLSYAFLPIHLWTTDAHEYAVLPETGWIQEGVAGYVLAP